MKAVVATFNQEKALLGAFSVIIQLRDCTTSPINRLQHYFIPLTLLWCSLVLGQVRINSMFNLVAGAASTSNILHSDTGSKENNMFDKEGDN